MTNTSAAPEQAQAQSQVPSPAQTAGQALLDIDHQVHEAVAGHDRTIPVRAIGLFSDLADQAPLRIVCCGMIAAGLWRRDRRMAAAGLRMLITHELATVAKNAIKSRVDRKRPRSASARHEKEPRPGHSSDKEDTSFPSGHSAGAMAVAAAFAAEYPHYRAPALATAGAMALAQIPRCAHYPTDVGAGLAIGAAAHGVVAPFWKGAVRLAFSALRRG